MQDADRACIEERSKRDLLEYWVSLYLIVPRYDDRWRGKRVVNLIDVRYYSYVVGSDAKQCLDNESWSRVKRGLIPPREHETRHR